ncbi:e3 ubiquitin-protein ligase protein [Anaeramoeba ignava]|uniref:E3 ubiquitin-protein ligase protein n=1 Tax=Anaeramoeba ignava TaxID=1746090 RepID=A0A9Q0LYF5_ANAIG|nr:e3 ubiquitin-protein ligase protein [Anaeramoeba ignava]
MNEDNLNWIENLTQKKLNLNFDMNELSQVLVELMKIIEENQGILNPLPFNENKKSALENFNWIIKISKNLGILEKSCFDPEEVIENQNFQLINKFVSKMKKIYEIKNSLEKINFLNFYSHLIKTEETISQAILVVTDLFEGSMSIDCYYFPETLSKLSEFAYFQRKILEIISKKLKNQVLLFLESEINKKQTCIFTSEMGYFRDSKKISKIIKNYYEEYKEYKEIDKEKPVSLSEILVSKKLKKGKYIYEALAGNLPVLDQKEFDVIVQQKVQDQLQIENQKISFDSKNIRIFSKNSEIQKKISNLDIVEYIEDTHFLQIRFLNQEAPLEIKFEFEILGMLVKKMIVYLKERQKTVGKIKSKEFESLRKYLHQDDLTNKNDWMGNKEENTKKDEERKMEQVGIEEEYKQKMLLEKKQENICKGELKIRNNFAGGKAEFKDVGIERDQYISKCSIELFSYFFTIENWDGEKSVYRYDQKDFEIDLDQNEIQKIVIKEDGKVILKIVFSSGAEKTIFWKTYLLFKKYPGRFVESWDICGEIIDENQEYQILAFRCWINTEASFQIRVMDPYMQAVPAVLRLSKSHLGIFVRDTQPDILKWTDFSMEINTQPKDTKLLEVVLKKIENSLSYFFVCESKSQQNLILHCLRTFYDFQVMIRKKNKNTKELPIVDEDVEEIVVNEMQKTAAMNNSKWSSEGTFPCSKYHYPVILRKDLKQEIQIYSPLFTKTVEQTQRYESKHILTATSYLYVPYYEQQKNPTLKTRVMDQIVVRILDSHLQIVSMGKIVLFDTHFSLEFGPTIILRFYSFYSKAIIDKLNPLQCKFCVDEIDYINISFPSQELARLFHKKFQLFRNLYLIQDSNMQITHKFPCVFITKEEKYPGSIKLKCDRIKIDSDVDHLVLEYSLSNEAVVFQSQENSIDLKLSELTSLLLRFPDTTTMNQFTRSFEELKLRYFSYSIGQQFFRFSLVLEEIAKFSSSELCDFILTKQRVTIFHRNNTVETYKLADCFIYDIPKNNECKMQLFHSKFVILSFPDNSTKTEFIEKSIDFGLEAFFENSSWNFAIFLHEKGPNSTSKKGLLYLKEDSIVIVDDSSKYQNSITETEILTHPKHNLLLQISFIDQRSFVVSFEDEARKQLFINNFRKVNLNILHKHQKKEGYESDADESDPKSPQQDPQLPSSFLILICDQDSHPSKTASLSLTPSGILISSSSFHVFSTYNHFAIKTHSKKKDLIRLEFPDTSSLTIKFPDNLIVDNFFLNFNLFSKNQNLNNQNLQNQNLNNQNLQNQNLHNQNLQNQNLNNQNLNNQNLNNQNLNNQNLQNQNLQNQNLQNQNLQNQNLNNQNLNNQNLQNQNLNNQNLNNQNLQNQNLNNQNLQNQNLQNQNLNNQNSQNQNLNNQNLNNQNLNNQNLNNQNLHNQNPYLLNIKKFKVILNGKFEQLSDFQNQQAKIIFFQDNLFKFETKSTEIKLTKSKIFIDNQQIINLQNSLENEKNIHFETKEMKVDISFNSKEEKIQFMQLSQKAESKTNIQKNSEIENLFFNVFIQESQTTTKKQAEIKLTKNKIIVSYQNSNQTTFSLANISQFFLDPKHESLIRLQFRDSSTLGIHMKSKEERSIFYAHFQTIANQIQQNPNQPIKLLQNKKYNIKILKGFFHSNISARMWIDSNELKLDLNPKLMSFQIFPTKTRIFSDPKNAKKASISSTNRKKTQITFESEKEKIEFIELLNFSIKCLRNFQKESRPKRKIIQNSNLQNKNERSSESFSSSIIIDQSENTFVFNVQILHDQFTFSDGELILNPKYISLKDERAQKISDNLSDCSVTFDPDKNIIAYIHFKTEKKKIGFRDESLKMKFQKKWDEFIKIKN